MNARRATANRGAKNLVWIENGQGPDLTRGLAAGKIEIRRCGRWVLSSSIEGFGAELLNARRYEAATSGAGGGAVAVADRMISQDLFSPLCM